MGTYINKGNSEFRDIVTHEYVDKTSLIPLINATPNSELRYSCVTPTIMDEYVIHRKYATGKGYADLVMNPRRNISKPALVNELTNEREESGACSNYPERGGSRRSQLKFNHSAETAISQIKQKNYPSKIADYTGDILLVGINYDKETKQHSCKIEKYNKSSY